MAVWGLASTGVVVPLVLALLAPSFESLLATSRPVLMSFAIAVLSLLTIVLRLTGRLWHELARLTHHAYDLLLFLPLSVEVALAKRREAGTTATAAAVNAAPNVLAVDFDKNRGALKTTANPDSIAE